MATKGLWNVGGLNLPDLGLNEWLYKTTGMQVGALNSNQMGTQMGDTSKTQPVIDQYNKNTSSGGGASSWSVAPTVKSGPVNTSSGGYNPDTTYVMRNGETKKVSDWLSQGVDPFASQTGPSEADFNAIYNPAFAALDQQKAQAEQQSALDQQSTLDTAANQKSNLKAQEAQAQLQYDSKLQDAQASKLTALQEAQRDFLALQQQGNSRWGQGSSTGGAVNAIAQEQYLRNEGNVAQKYIGIYKDLQDWSNSVKTYVTQKSGEIDSWISNALQQLKLSYSNQVNQINAQRGQLESDKAAKKLAVQQQVYDYAKQISSIKEQAAVSLDTWKQQQDYLVQNEMNKLYSNTPATNISLPQQQLTSTTQTQSSPLQNIRWNPTTKKYEGEDQYGSVVSLQT